VVTFYFTLEAVSVLLGARFLVGCLVVLLGALTVVVHPLYSVLLQRIIILELRSFIKCFSSITKSFSEDVFLFIL